MSSMRPMRANLDWIWHHFILFVFQPAEFLKQTNKFSQPRQRFYYLLKFLILPMLILTFITVSTELACSALHIRYSGASTFLSMTFGIILGTIFGFPVGMRFGVAYGLLFGMAVGVMTGYPFSIWVTIPLPNNHILPNVAFQHTLFPYVNSAKALLFEPMRDVFITAATGILGGLYYKTIVAVLGRPTHGIIFAIALGSLYGLAVIVFVDPMIGVLSGFLFATFVAIGFASRNQFVGSLIFSLAFGIGFGLPIWQSYHYAPQPAFEPLRWSLCVGGATFFFFWLTYQRYLFYPFQAVRTAWLYFTIGKYGDAMARWQRVPIVWDDTIQVPLPFITEFLIRIGKEDRRNGRDQIAFLAANRRSHHHVATDAFVQLIPEDLEVESTDDIAQISSKIEWMRDIPDDLIKGLSIILADFDRIASLMKTYAITDRQLTDRRKGLLDKALQETEALQKSLHFKDADATIKFLETANMWLSVLRKERESYPPTATKQIPQIFVCGPPLRENSEIFVGRTEIFSSIDHWCLHVDQSPTISFYGPRRMGKTSLLKQLSRNVSSQIVPVILDCLDARMTASIESHIHVFTQTISMALAKRGIAFDPIAMTTLENEPFACLRNWLHQLMTKLDQYKLLVCIDEYEKLDTLLQYPWGKYLFDNYRYIMQHHDDYPKLFFMFTGAASFDRLGREWTDSFIHAHSISISFLTAEQAMELLNAPCLSSDLTYQDGCIAKILEETQGQPFLLQAVGWNLIERLNEKQRTMVTREDVDIAISNVIAASATIYFANCWSDATEEGQEILIATVRHSGIPDFAEARKRLIEDAVLTNQGEFAVPMFKRWVVLNHGKDSS